jgi:hypothetical protein
VAHRSPQVDHLTIELHVHLVEVPAPLAEATHPAHPLATDVARKQWAEPVLPQPYPLMTDVDPALEQQVLHVPQHSGNRTYIITTSRIISGDELKRRKGLAGSALDLRLMLPS